MTKVATGAIRGAVAGAFHRATLLAVALLGILVLLPAVFAAAGHPLLAIP
jgi:hypothetical protein